jgi:hypothetical protein
MSPLVLETGRDGVLEGTTPEKVRALAAAIVATPRSVIHVHGGLVSKKQALATAARLDPLYRAEGVLPVFPVWKSGLLEVIRAHAREIFGEEIFRVLFKHLLAHAGGKLMQQRGGGGEPYTPLNDAAVERALEQADRAARDPSAPEPLLGLQPETPPDPVTPEEEDRFAEELNESPELAAAILRVKIRLGLSTWTALPGVPIIGVKTLMSRHIKEELRAEDARARGIARSAVIIKHAVFILTRIIKRFVQKRDHGLYATTVEEICRDLYIDAAGAWVWGRMLNDTGGAFEPGSAQKPRGGTLLMQEIGKLMGQFAAAGAQLPKISIVAHSAGSVWACHFLQHLLKLRSAGTFPRAFQMDRLILLAPACTSARFASILTLPAPTPLFSEFRMFALDDAHEAGYWEAPPLYPRSLLYMVSGMFETEVDAPLLGMERYFRRSAVYKEEGVVASRKYLSVPASHAVWAVVNGGPGLSCGSIRHGGFCDSGPPLPSTFASVLYFLTN